MTPGRPRASGTAPRRLNAPSPGRRHRQSALATPTSSQKLQPPAHRCRRIRASITRRRSAPYCSSRPPRLQGSGAATMRGCGRPWTGSRRQWRRSASRQGRRCQRNPACTIPRACPDRHASASWKNVVDVQFAGVVGVVAVEGGQPAARREAGQVGAAFLGEHFASGVASVTVSVDPASAEQFTLVRVVESPSDLRRRLRRRYGRADRARPPALPGGSGTRAGCPGSAKPRRRADRRPAGSRPGGPRPG